MTYQLSSATLLASTYGQTFDPTTEQPPHVLAQNLDPSGDIQSELSNLVKTWTSDPGDTSETAMSRAVTDVGDALTSALGQSYTLQSGSSTYRTIYDALGNEIGHEAVAWVEVDGAYLFQASTTSPQVGMYGCIFLAVRPVPGSFS